MICMNATEANLVQRSELQFPWQPAAASKAQTTGQKVRLALKGGRQRSVFSHGMRTSAIFGVRAQGSISDSTNEPLGELPPTALVFLPVKQG